MIALVVSWAVFQIRYLAKNTVFVKEEENQWVLCTYDDYAFIKCYVAKKSGEENIMFVQRYFIDRPNVVRVEGIEIEYEQVTETSDQLLDIQSEGGLNENQRSEKEEILEEIEEDLANEL